MVDHVYGAVDFLITGGRSPAKSAISNVLKGDARYVSDPHISMSFFRARERPDNTQPFSQAVIIGELL